MESMSGFDKLDQVNEFAWSLYNSNPAHVPKRNMGTNSLTELIGIFEKRKVQYLLIGDFAMAFYGHVCATDKLELWVKNTPENISNIRSALFQIGTFESTKTRNTAEVVTVSMTLNFLSTDFKINLLHKLLEFAESDFDSCYGRATIADYHGIKIPVLAAEDLLLEKKSVSREKDTGDISFLQTLLNKLSPGKGENKKDKGMGM